MHDPVRQARRRMARRRSAARDVRPIPVIARTGLLPILPFRDRRIVRIRPFEHRLPVAARRRQARRLQRLLRRRGRRLARLRPRARTVQRPDLERLLRLVRQRLHDIAGRRRAAACHRLPGPIIALASLAPILVLRDRRVARMAPRQPHLRIPGLGRQTRRLRRLRDRRRRRLRRREAMPLAVGRPNPERIRRPVRQAPHRVARRRRTAACHVRPGPVLPGARLLLILVLRDRRIVRIRPRQLRLPVAARRLQARRPGRHRRRRRRRRIRLRAGADRVHRPHLERVNRPVRQPRCQMARRAGAAARNRRPVPVTASPFPLPILVLRDRRAPAAAGSPRQQRFAVPLPPLADCSASPALPPASPSPRPIPPPRPTRSPPAP